MRLSDVLQDRLDTANKSRAHVMAMAIQKQKRIEELEAKLSICERHRDAYAECDRIGTQAVRDLEAKLAKAVEALRNILSCDDLYPWRIAREVLAELEKKT